MCRTAACCVSIIATCRQRNQSQFLDSTGCVIQGPSDQYIIRSKSSGINFGSPVKSLSIWYLETFQLLNKLGLSQAKSGFQLDLDFHTCIHGFTWLRCAIISFAGGVGRTDGRTENDFNAISTPTLQLQLNLFGKLGPDLVIKELIT